MNFHPAYFTVRFTVEPPHPTWPAAFVLITAWATTGEEWPEEKNHEADRALEQRLVDAGVWYHRVTGFSPATGHAEPGWAVELPVTDALALGREFKQDAIYVVDDDRMAVVRCEGGETAVVGSFRERIDA
jgi:hypothetical protein